MLTYLFKYNIHKWGSYLIFQTEGRGVQGKAGFAHRIQYSEIWTASLKDLHRLRGVLQTAVPFKHKNSYSSTKIKCCPYHYTSSTSSSSRQCKKSSMKRKSAKWSNDLHYTGEILSTVSYRQAVAYLPISTWKHSPRQKRIFCHIGRGEGSPIHLPAGRKEL